MFLSLTIPYVGSITDVKYGLRWNRDCRDYFATIIFEMSSIVAEMTPENKQINIQTNAYFS